MKKNEEKGKNCRVWKPMIRNDDDGDDDDKDDGGDGRREKDK